MEEKKAETEDSMGKLQIERLILGMIRTNSWLAVNRETKEVLFIDPADEAEKIQKKVTELGLTPAGILLTHGHFDHIGAVDVLKEIYGIECYAGAEEKEVLENPAFNLSSSYGVGYAVYADHFLKDGEVFELAGFEIRVIAAPGHTKGGVCYYLPQEKVVFSGDTLFKTSIGRTDLPTGSMGTLVRSVRSLLSVLPEDTLVYPGHDLETKVSFERRFNPFI